MEKEEYQTLIYGLISLVKDKSGYIKSIKREEYDKNPEFYKGMQLAFYLTLDEIKSYLKSQNDDTLRIEDYGLNDFDLSEIMDYKPEN